MTTLECVNMLSTDLKQQSPKSERNIVNGWSWWVRCLKKKRQHESNKAKNSAKVATTLRTSVYDSRTEELENAC